MTDIDDEFERQFAAAQASRREARERIGLRAVTADERANPNTIPLAAQLTDTEWRTDWLPTPVALWVEACHQALGVPKVMAIAAAMTAAATVLQGKAEVELREGWREPLSLYWLVFCGTGSRKSALLKLAKAPVLALQAAKAAELAQEQRQARNQRARLEAQIARLRRSAKMDSWTDGSQEARRNLADLEHELATTEVPKAPHWLYDDINPTVIPRKLRSNHEAEGIARLAVMDAEGTFLANALGRHSGSANVDLLLKGYSGDSIDMVRVIQGQEETMDVCLPAVHLTVLQLVQPHILSDLKGEPRLGDNGFLGRCLLSNCETFSEPDYDAPAVAPEVQAAYARWIASLDLCEPETVYRMPPEAQALLRRLHGEMTAHRKEGLGAAGWIARSCGRICRLVAIVELSQLSHCHTGGGGRGPREVLEIILYLYNTIYLAGLAHARGVEPNREPTATLSRRALRHLGQFNSVTVGHGAGSIITLRQLMRGLHIGREDAVTVAEELLESGHLEVVEERKHRNKTVTVTYRVISLDPDAGSAP